MGLFNFFKKKKEKKDWEEKEIRERVTYMGSLIEGTNMLESGEKFDSDKFYNPEKHLKYNLKEIEQSLLFTRLYLANDNQDLINAIGVGYMYLGCFDNKDVKDKADTAVSTFTNITEQNKLNDNPSIEEVRQLAEKYTDVHNDTLSKLGDDLMEMKKNRMDNFDEIIKKFKQDNEKT